MRPKVIQRLVVLVLLLPVLCRLRGEVVPRGALGPALYVKWFLWLLDRVDVHVVVLAALEPRLL